MASFEKANLNSSTLELLFDEDDLAFLEYADELDNYWKKAYGHPIIAQLACQLVSNIFETAERKLNENWGFDAVFEFAHLETLLPVYAAFNLFRDSPSQFQANASREFFSNRNFKTSKMAPFAGNTAFLFVIIFFAFEISKF